MLAQTHELSIADPEFRQKLVEAATRLGKAAEYRSAGTIEFLVDQDTHKFYFLEVNTRLQVSIHPFNLQAVLREKQTAFSCNGLLQKAVVGSMIFRRSDAGLPAATSRDYQSPIGKDL